MPSIHRVNTSVVTTPAQADFDFGTGAFTLEGWFNFDTVAAAVYMLMGNRGNDTGAAYAQMYVNTSAAQAVFHFTGGTPGASFTSFTPVVGTWYHFCATRTAGGVCVLYINAVAGGGSLTYALTASSARAFELGSYNGATNPFTGFVGQCRGYARALSANDVKNRYLRGLDDPAMRTSLVADWQFSEGTGSTVADATGRGHTLALTNTTWSTSTPPRRVRAGKSAGAMAMF